MMTKPAFGDVRAPRQWNETADHALTKEVGLWKHRLDGCIYLSTRVATKEDAEFEVFEHNGEMLVVDGVFQLEKESQRLRMLTNHKENRSATRRDSTCCSTGSSSEAWTTRTSKCFVVARSLRLWMLAA